MKRLFRNAACLSVAIALYACGGGTAEIESPFFDGERPGPGVSVGSGSGVQEIAGIPNDNMADPNPEIDPSDVNATIPNISHEAEREGNDVIIRVNMTGVRNENAIDPADEWLRLIGTGEPGQNVWIEIDGQPKGIDVYNTIDGVEDENVGAVLNDFVFLVDNSGSMSEEADVIARDITAWAQTLNNTLDVRFGLVGYDGCIHGAIDVSSYEDMDAYLNDRGRSGTYRTNGFVGTNADDLQTAALGYGSNCQDECGVAALRFADENFTFRPGANRIYVNFTDEGNFPNGAAEFSVEYVENDWLSNQGTIHSVISNKSLIPLSETQYYCEDPTRMSTATGGTILTTDSSFSDVTLSNLPVTGAMQNSYVIRFTNVAEFLDGLPHEVKITIVSADGSVKAEEVFYLTFELV